MGEPATVPGRAWVVTAAGTTINLCLGILYAWSVWKAALLAPKDVAPGTPMTGLNAGWAYLSDTEATVAYTACGFVFALAMIPGGRLQDRYGPRAGATLAGVLLGAGCAVAGLTQSFLGLVLGYGLLGGLGMGFGYAAATPAAVRWFGPHRRGLIVGLVVAGYGAAAVYIAQIAKRLIAEHGLNGSFVGLGGLFAVVIVVAAQFLKMPPPGYAPPAAPLSNKPRAGTGADHTAGEVLGTWQFYALVYLFVASAQSGLLVIGNAALLFKETTTAAPEWAKFAWVLASFGGVVNAAGRVGTGSYSDALGRTNAYTLNAIVGIVCLVALPFVVASGNVPALFFLVGLVFWQYGGTLSLMPALTADFYGAKNLGLNYGLVFLGWGIAFFVPLAGGLIKDATGSLTGAFFLSAGLLAVGVLVSRILTRPASSGH